MTTAFLDRPERITLAFAAETSDEAVAQAKAWAHNEPKVRIKTLCSVKRGGVNDGQWLVELAVRWLA